MKETPLFKERVNLVVGPEEITDQDAFKNFPQDLSKDGRGSRRGDHIVNDLVVGETPEPIGFPQNPPPCFIDIQKGTGSGHHPQGFVPGEKDLGKTLPGKGEAPWSDREIEAAVEIGNHLSQRKSEIKVEISGLDQQTNPYGAFGKGILNRRFYGFMTFRAIVNLDDMFCDDGLHLRKIFGNALSGRDGLSEGTETLRAVGKSVGFNFIDSFGKGPTDSWMPLSFCRVSSYDL